MKYKFLFITTQLLGIAFFVYLASTGNLINNYIWIFTSIFITLTLPSLLSKAIFKSTLFGFTTVLLFLYYPISYVAVLLLSKLTQINITDLSHGAFIITIFLWNISLIEILISEKVSHLKKSFLNAFAVIIPLALVSIALVLLTRSPDSIVATDYLQHQSVINISLHDARFCFTPDGCSNLFLQIGYTTFFHSLQAAIGSFSGNDLLRSLYVLDMVWPILMGLVTFKLFYKIFKNYYLAMLGTLLSFFTFINWAYDFQFFIPQTFTFFLFLNLIASHKLKFWKVLIGCLILFLGHFIIGAILSVILLVKYILVDKLYIKDKNIKDMHFLIDFSILVMLISMFFSIQGFSFEQYFQQGDISIIGNPTNPNFTGNVNTLIGIFGFNFIILVIGIIHYFRNKHLSRSRYTLFSILYICINLTLFFLGPTYSGKFLIGMGIFTAIIIVNYIKDVNINAVGIVIFGGMLLISSIINFTGTYSQYLSFYTHADKQVSALDTNDKEIIQYLNHYPKNCLIVSDPYTQLIIAGLTNDQTANAQYMLTDSRQKLLDFYKTPEDDTFNDLLKIKELNGVNNPCFLYTSRIESSIKLNNDLWTNNLYTYIINNNFTIGDTSDLINFMKGKGYLITFKNKNFILFEQINNPS